ncbi:MAG: SCO6745 family protein [Acidimicrobiales bacterium]
MTAPARVLRNVAEPLAASVFFAPEAHAEYEALGFPHPVDERNGVRMLDWGVYYATRAACMGAVAGEVATAVFGVFPARLVVGPVEDAWARSSPEALLAARERGAVAALERMIGALASPGELERAAAILRRGVEAADLAGKALFAGLRSLGWPESRLGALWRACDLYREHRGDAHVAGWSAAGLTGPEACILNDLRQGLGLKTYVRTRGWTDEELDRAVARLAERGWVDERGVTEAGRRFREELEEATDRQQAPIIDAIGGDLDELVGLLRPWREAVVAAGGYPGRAFVESAAAPDTAAGVFLGQQRTSS